MKKVFLITVLLMVIAAPSFALTVAKATGQLEMGGTDSSPEFSCGLSNEVRAHYVTDGVSGTAAQWYAIGTYHLGGNNVYGTAQDITNVYKLSDTAAKAPGAKYTAWTGFPEDSDSSNLWSGDIWQAL